jgi:prevent-host-death family protein
MDRRPIMMQSTWQLQEAKGNFSQLVKQAAAGVAQVVTVHGKPTAVVVSAQQYAQLTRRKQRLSSALLQPDLAIDDLDLARSRDTGRDIAL